MAQSHKHAGDVTELPGSISRVTGISGRPVKHVGPATGDSIAWNGRAWAPGGVRVFSVAAFGAKGDGHTDDTKAIQSAINTCVAAGGGVVHFPTGTYMLSTYLTITGPNVTLFGLQGGTTLKLLPSYVSGPNGQMHISAKGFDHITIDGLTFDGNNANVPHDPASNYAVLLWNCSYGTIRNCFATALNSGGSNANGAFNWVGTSHYGLAANNRIISCNGGGIFFQGFDCIAVGNQLSVLNDVGIVFNETNCSRGVATGNTIDRIPAQSAFAVEAGASEFCITGNVVNACFAGLDLNDAGYAGPQQVGGIYANNLVKDLDSAGQQAFTAGVLVRTAWMRDVKIANNVFSGLKPYGATDAFVFMNTASTEGFEIVNNTFEDTGQGVPAGIIFSTSPATHAKTRIEGNTFRSTSSTSKLTRGIWKTASTTYTSAAIRNNIFENCTTGVQFDASVSYSGEMKDSWALSGVTNMYTGSPWGTFSAITVPHRFRNTIGHSELFWGNAPTTGTWVLGDRVWNNNVTATSTPGWICTTAGTPGTWTAMPVL